VEESISMRVFISLICVVFISVACTTIKQETDKKEQPAISIVDKHKELDNLSLKGQVSFNQKDMQLTGKFKSYLAGTDSLSLILLGPLQIAAGKLYARNDYFLFYDAFNNRAYEGEPNAQNLKSAFNIELSFPDLIRLFRGEIPNNATKYVFDKTIEKGILFKYIKPEEYVDFALFDKNNNLIQYQRKLSDGILIMNVVYSDYQNLDGFELPGKISLSFPVYEATVLYEIDDYKVNEDFNHPFGFSVPSDIKRIKY
jgi:hypothetical protein